MTRSDRDGGVKELVRRHWNGRAATFDDASHHGIHGDEQRERWLSVLREWTDTGDDAGSGSQDRRVLDVGCGTGVVSLLLAELGHDVTGVDFAPEMLERARTKARAADRPDRSIAFCRGDAEALPLPDGAFDVVTARHLIWTLPNPQTALAEWQRVLEPGGRLVLLEGYWDHDEPWDEYEAVHEDLPLYDGRPADALREELERAGLRDIEHEPLSDPALWGREPRHEYYGIAGTVPE
ncbi:class I SAM-dependent methyltransferase [Halopiger xanaduensis]|uniref:Methyltransferase type 11 n=1 Tax=Halopiger xanaduensis (strain DSM 18323 / JCM 14033 / SH-6) TaxID=797210 RepID=F8D9X9_HALXS|nr:class I SAM-dependent methyltransferase [Halopiger xanaduensis]AEH35759.1 Methyltransferase type 11 [Halopiger xanaduensis SH-6]